MQKMVAMVAAGTVTVMAASAGAQTFTTAPTFTAPAPVTTTTTTDLSGVPAVTSPAITTMQAGTDLDVVVHHLGLRYFGAEQVGSLECPTAGGATCSPTASTTGLTVPTIGIRYWFSHGVALDVGLGLGFSGGGASATSSMAATGASTTTNAPTPFNFAIGVAMQLPITVAAYRHINLYIAPTLGFFQGFGSLDQNPTPARYISDQLSTTRFRVGGRAAAEVHLGFIGLPQVSIEAGFGAQLDILAASRTNADTGMITTVSNVNVGFATTAGAFSIGEILTSSLSANYYF